MPAGRTYTPIFKNTVTNSSTSLVTFTGIPSTYTDLVLVGLIQMTDATTFYIRCNNDTTNKYSVTFISGDGTTALSSKFDQTGLGGNGIYTNATSFPTTATLSATFGAATWNFMNYSNTTTHKTVISRVGHGRLSSKAFVNCYANTSAITSLDIRPFSGTFGTGSNFILYGIAAA